MNYRIAMTFDLDRRCWIVTQCYEGKGPVPMVRRYRDGSKELILTWFDAVPIGDSADPFRMLILWQHRAIRQRRIAESKASRINPQHRGINGQDHARRSNPSPTA